MKFVDVLVTTEEDARTVFGVAAASPAETALALAKRFGIGVVALTIRESDDDCGAVIVADNAAYTAPRHQVEVVDRVGAGDAFTAGLIVARLEGRDWDVAARFATALGALKLTIPGDFCLTTRSEVERLMRGADSKAMR
jgi:2-dehydro-3-deoxygluconokinase